MPKQHHNKLRWLLCVALLALIGGVIAVNRILDWETARECQYKISRLWMISITSGLLDARFH